LNQEIVSVQKETNPERRRNRVNMYNE